MKIWSGIVAAAVLMAASLNAQVVTPPGGADDPLAEFLDGKAPQVVRETPPTEAVPAGVKVRRLVFRLRDDAEILAIVASPIAPGPHPAMLVLHGGHGYAQESSAVRWAKLGYVALAPDLPGIAKKEKLVESKGQWKAIVDSKGKYSPVPNSGILDVVGPALKALDLLLAQPNVDTKHVGVWGISLGGYTTTMVCGLVGDKVQAGYSLWGCGFYELNSQNKHLRPMPAAEREAWLKYFDAGRRAPAIKAPFFVLGATNDFFFFIPSVQATLNVMPETFKNHVFVANADHKMDIPGGKKGGGYFADGDGPGNIERTFFDYHLRGIGKPLPIVTAIKSDNPMIARFKVNSPTPITQTVVYWSSDNPDWGKRNWIAASATKLADGTYEARLPAEAAGGIWFGSASDDRPVTASTDLVYLPPQAR